MKSSQGGEMSRYQKWVCRECGQVVLAEKKPAPFRWTDGHVCHFKEEKDS